MINPNLKAKDRIYEGLPEDLKQLMREYVLSDEEHQRVLNDIKLEAYKGKIPSEKPKFTIVLGQTGAGKSNLTAYLINKDSNTVIIDSDKYKGYRSDSSEIQKKYLVYYAYLTAPDAYQHRDEMICDTMASKYNILLECATTQKDGMFVDINKIRQMGYDVDVAVLGVSDFNSLLSVHERYENQIDLNIESAKLTSIERHDDSFNSLKKCIEDINESDINVTVYTRGNEYPFMPKKIYSSNSGVRNFENAKIALDYAQEQDKKRTMSTFNHRYSIIQQRMMRRNAPMKQIEQLNNVFNRYSKEIEKETQNHI